MLAHPLLSLHRARLLIFRPRLPERHVMSPDLTLPIRAAHPIHDAPEEAEVVPAMRMTTCPSRHQHPRRTNANRRRWTRTEENKSEEAQKKTKKKNSLNLMIARREHQPAGQGHDGQDQRMKGHDPRTHPVPGMADQGGEQDERQGRHPTPPVPARQHRPRDPRHADLDEVLGQLGVADGEDVHRVRVLVVHGVEVGV